MPSLKHLTLAGFKSIRQLAVELGPLNVFIGPNGAGKSNFLSFFRMLNAVTDEKLQLFVGRQGGANSLLHYGRKRTPQLQAAMTFDIDTGINSYNLTLIGVAPDDLLFADEEVKHQPKLGPERATRLGGGHRESRLSEAIRGNDLTARTVKWTVDRWRTYHFHDTSPDSAIKQKCQILDNRYLKADGANLAAFLHMLKGAYPAHYDQIRDTIRRVTPFFDDFVLEPDALNRNMISLAWREKGEESLFLAHHLSDGTLRFMALTTALNQPREHQNSPDLIVIDEPELGLHPYAITLLAAMIRAASQSTQVIVSTQSINLLDELAEPSNIVVVERSDRQSVFRRLDESALEGWLKEYSLGELWEKNVLGGRP